MQKYNNKEYCNYHKHDHVSSIFTPDTYIKCEEYIKRAVELGHNTYFTTNHGSGGDIFEAKSVCDKYKIRCLFGIEAYIVPNPYEKDNRNYHIILIPKTNKARKKLNLITSRANIDGYYYKPRIFIEDLLKLDKEDIYITTACVAGIIRDKDGFNQIFLPLVKHFENNVFLEVQSHNEEIQKEINKKCLSLAKEYNLLLIAANDSHYIYPEQAKDRDMYLKGKGINYGDENNFILDYPNYETMVERFREQDVLSESEIISAIDNTNVFMNCEDIYINKEIKMPSIYPTYSAKEKIEELKNHVNDKFKKICKEENITGDLRKTYMQGIYDEMKVISDTAEINTADYFLFNEKNTDLAINKYNGILTKTGRGSCGSFYINRILGMTQLDRFTSPIKLYPERFMSTARLLENRATPDVDFNVVSQEPFIQASKELLGEHGCYPMVAYGTMKDGEAFRNICRSHSLNFDEYNDVAKNIEKYTNDTKWIKYIEESKKFIGSIVSCSVHPCAFVLDNKDLREEYGVIKVGNSICVMMTSSEADEYKFLKNDYLIVSCWKLISKTFNMINKPIMSIVDLLKNIDDKVWNLYANGMTCTLNQCDGDWATSMLKDYKPVNVAELSMFVSAIRPSFNSWRDTYISRAAYSTGCKQLDDVLKSTNGFILFQENLMQYFDWLGVTPAESIGLIKKISKKKIHQEDFDKLESRLKIKWIENTDTIDMFSETWSMIQSCISYGFCSAHALAVAIDSLYSAYLKANYPLEYYTVALSMYSDDMSTTAKLINELPYFNIILNPIKYGKSKSDYTYDKKTNSIYKGISSIKYCNQIIAEELYQLSQNFKTDNFIELLEQIKQKTSINSRQLKILITLNFFSDFGNNKKLLKVSELYDTFIDRKQIKKSDVEKLNIDIDIFLKYVNSETGKMYKDINMIGYIYEISAKIEDKSLSIKEQISAELEYLEYIDYINPKSPDNFYYVMEYKTYKDKCKPYVTLYHLKTGDAIKTKVTVVKDFSLNPFTLGSVLNVLEFKDKEKTKMINGSWEKTGEFEKVLKSWEVY